MLIRNVAGFTLLELLITLSILMTLQFWALPSLNHLLINNRTAVIINRIKTSIRVARIEAVERQSTVRFCASRKNNACTGDWQQGQIIQDLETGEVLRTYSALPKGYRLIWKSAFERDHYLDFNSEGFTRGQQGSFYCCIDHKPQYSRGLVVSRSGRVRELSDISKLRTTCLSLG